MGRWVTRSGPEGLDPSEKIYEIEGPQLDSGSTKLKDKMTRKDINDIIYYVKNNYNVKIRVNYNAVLLNPSNRKIFFSDCFFGSYITNFNNEEKEALVFGSPSSYSNRNYTAVVIGITTRAIYLITWTN